MSDMLERLKDHGLFDEIDALLNKCEFIANPGDLYLIDNYYFMYLYFEPRTKFDKNIHIFVNFDGVMRARNAWVPDGFFGFNFKDINNINNMIFISITDKRLSSINITKCGSVSNDLLKFFEDQFKIELLKAQLIQIIET